MLSGETMNSTIKAAFFQNEEWRTNTFKCSVWSPRKRWEKKNDKRKCENSIMQ